MLKRSKGGKHSTDGTQPVRGTRFPEPQPSAQAAKSGEVRWLEDKAAGTAKGLPLPGRLERWGRGFWARFSLYCVNLALAPEWFWFCLR
jgi:hypothetical protein